MLPDFEPCVYVCIRDEDRQQYVMKTARTMERERGVLDALGEELTSVLTPVSVCMMATVVLVMLLKPQEAENGADTVAIATLYYHEESSDPVGEKLFGSVVNALFFVVLVGALTFVLVLLFKYGCARCIWAYMGFAGLQIFAVLGGIVSLQLIDRLQLSIDAVSFSVVLWNFSCVGVLAVFFWPLPLFLKQGYLVFIGTITAFWFTKIPAWSTWTMLIGMALYDLYAVLTPGGPLKMLVDIAVERKEELPALVYEANPSADSAAVIEAAGSGPGPDNAPAILRAAPRRMSRGGGAAAQQQSEMEMQETPRASIHALEKGVVSDNEQAETLAGTRTSSTMRTPHTHRVIATPGASTSARRAGDDRETRSAVQNASREEQQEQQQQQQRLHHRDESEEGDDSSDSSDDDDDELSGSVKLGLGDFIFYSVLVGRAAMYDTLTMFSCYFAIVAGLGITFLLLALYQRALPALPFSIALGTIFYFATRFSLEQMIIGFSLAGAAF